MPLTVVLPMPRAHVRAGLHEPSHASSSRRLCAAAVEVFELPLLARQHRAGPSSDQGPGRSRQYAQLGVFLCAHCHVLLALWDGKDSDQLGGTSQVVRFHHHDVMPGYTPRATASRLNLTDDESDLVYHIVCSRDRPDGAAGAGTRSRSTRSGSRPTKTQPRVRRNAGAASQGLCVHERVQPRGAVERGRDRQGALHAADGRAGDARCQPASGTSTRRSAPPTGSRSITRRSVMLTLKAGHVCALLTGVGYLTYTDLQSATPAIIGVHHRPDDLSPSAINALAVRGSLAAQVPRLPHAGRGPARAVLLGRGRRDERQRDQVRARQFPADAGHGTRLDPQRDARGGHGVRRRAEFRSARTEVHACEEWIGDDKSGQLGYYRKKSATSASSEHESDRADRPPRHLDDDRRAERAAVRRVATSPTTCRRPWCT